METKYFYTKPLGDEKVKIIVAELNEARQWKGLCPFCVGSHYKEFLVNLNTLIGTCAICHQSRELTRKTSNGDTPPEVKASEINEQIKVRTSETGKKKPPPTFNSDPRKKNDHQSITLLDSIFEHCAGGYIYIVSLHRDKSQNVSKIKYFPLKQIHLIPSYISLLINNFNCYFSPSVCKQDLGYAGRSKEHISAWPVLWCDIDIYKFDEIKRAEVWRLLKECPLQPTFIVKSGRGIHVYWKLREPCTDMSLIENYLNRIAAYFSGDRTEAAHLLRIPQTKNHKYEGEDAEVKIIHSQPENQYNLSEFDFFPETESTYGRGSKEDPGNYKNEMNERLKKIMECDFLRHCDRGRATLSEPEWHAMISILARETGGPNLIHSLSKGYPKYSPGETDKKILHTIDDAGPATCERIKTLWNCGKDCGVRSPVVLAGRAETDLFTAEKEWPDPIPFDEYSSLPDFSLDALSGIGREVVEAVSEVNQVDPALTGCLYLAALSSCCSRKAEIDLISHKEPLNLYLSPIYDSGNRKSSTTGDMTKPLYEFQRARQEDMRTTIQDAKNAFRIKEKRIERLQKKAAEEDDPEQRRQLEEETAKLTRDLAETPIPNSPIYLVDDVTPEKLGALMADNGERMAAITPEGGLFEIMAGRYSKDGVGNIDLFLKAHAGDFWSNHRIGREANTMRAPALTLCLAVQSEVLEEAGKNKHLKGKGLLARFLYSRCKSQIGYRKRQTISIPPSLSQRYRDHVFSLMEIPFTDNALRLSPDAQALWNEFYNDVEKEMRPGGSLYYLSDWGSKLPGAVARIAGLLHLAKLGVKGLSLPISVDIVSASCVIGAYFKEHAIAAFGLMQEDRRIKLARQIFEYIQRDRPETFKGRDVMRHTAIVVMDEVEQGLRVLMDRGYIREEPTDGDKRIGRPKAQMYKVNPKIFIEENV